MNSLAGLRERRELLVARSALQRLEVARDVQDLRAALSWPRAGLALATSPPVLGLALGVIGRGGLGRIVRIAAAAFAVFRLARALRRE
jgi:hypothetical protein